MCIECIVKQRQACASLIYYTILTMVILWYKVGWITRPPMPVSLLRPISVRDSPFRNLAHELRVTVRLIRQIHLRSQKSLCLKSGLLTNDSSSLRYLTSSTTTQTDPWYELTRYTSRPLHTLMPSPSLSSSTRWQVGKPDARMKQPRFP